MSTQQSIVETPFASSIQNITTTYVLETYQKVLLFSLTSPKYIEKYLPEPDSGLSENSN